MRIVFGVWNKGIYVADAERDSERERERERERDTEREREREREFTFLFICFFWSCWRVKEEEERGGGSYGMRDKQRGERQREG